MKERQPDNRIIDLFISEWVFTLATSSNNVPYSANCCYVYHNDPPSIIFKSSEGSKHIRDAIENRSVAGTVVPQRLSLLAMKGLQFTGELVIMPRIAKTLEKLYYARFPMAKMIYGKIWMIKLHSIKLVDNSLGFAKKIKWEFGKKTALT